MDVELAEIRDFLAAHAPFDTLPAEALAGAVRRSVLRYARRGSVVLDVGDHADGLFVVRSGAVDITDETGGLLERVGAGGGFGFSTLLEDRPNRYRVTAIEDTLLLVVPTEVFHELVGHQPGFGLFYTGTHTDRIHRAITQLQRASTGSSVLGTSVRELTRLQPVVTTPDATIQQAAAAMAEGGVSCIVIVDGGVLAGLVTDRDLRNRVLATGVDPGRPIRDVMTPEPVTLPDDALAFEALLEMVTRNIHHLPVVDRSGAPVGVVTTTDLIRLEQSNPVYLGAYIARQDSLDGVIEAAKRIPAVLIELVEQDATAEDIGRVVTALGDSVRRRVLSLVEADLGPPPTAYSWVVLGSVAREEEGLSADQDHALVVGEEGHDEWFAELAERVTAGLEACGWPRCPGEVMATNPSWRRTVKQWRRQFALWGREPGSDAVLHAATFYDMRHLAGDARLTRKVRQAVPETVSQRLVGHLGGQAARLRVPLGFFRGFVLDHRGGHRDTLDIKRGIAAVVQVARVQALRAGSDALSTRDRLLAARDKGYLSPEQATDLLEALELMSYLRLRHQVAQVRAGRHPDNRLAPDSLSDRERRHLKDAFGVVRDAQQDLANRMGPGYS